MERKKPDKSKATTPEKKGLSKVPDTLSHLSSSQVKIEEGISSSHPEDKSDLHELSSSALKSAPSKHSKTLSTSVDPNSSVLPDLAPNWP